MLRMCDDTYLGAVCFIEIPNKFLYLIEERLKMISIIKTMKLSCIRV